MHTLPDGWQRMAKRGVLILWLLWACAHVAQAQSQRIVSLLPSLTESVCALGRCSQLVGVDRYSNWPLSVQSLPKLGGGMDPNIEAVLALHPDVVLMANSARGVERLRALGLHVVTLEPQSYADVQSNLHQLAQVLHVPDAQAQRVLQQTDEALQRAAQSLNPQARGLRVYFEVSSTPHAAGERSFMGEMLRRLQLRNIVEASMGEFPAINPEWVVRSQPDVIMASDSSVSQMASRPGWSQLTAIRQHHVCAFNAEQTDVLARPGPRMGEGAALLVSCLNTLFPNPKAP